MPPFFSLTIPLLQPPYVRLHVLPILLPKPPHRLLLSHKHHPLTIHILIPPLPHPHLPRGQTPSLHLQRLDLRRRNPPHILLQMLVPRHRSLALHLRTNLGVAGGDSASSGAEHLAGDEGELVGAGEQHVEGGFELEDGFEHGAAAEDVQAEAGAG